MEVISLRISKKKLELAKARSCMSTQDLIAAGIPRGTMSRITRESVRPETVGKIAKALKVDVTEILED